MTVQRCTRAAQRIMSDFQTLWSVIYGLWLRIHDIAGKTLLIGAEYIGFGELKAYNQLPHEMKEYHFVCENSEELLMLLALQVPPYRSGQVSEDLRTKYTAILTKESSVVTKVEKLVKAGMLVMEDTDSFSRRKVEGNTLPAEMGSG